MEQFFTPTPSNENCLIKSRGKNANFIKRPLLGVIHAALDHIVFTIYTAPDLKYLVARKQKIEIYRPQEKWCEQNPEEIMTAIYTCCNQACNDLIHMGYMRADIEGVSITNHRGTVVVWDASTGEPLYNAITANDQRASTISERIISSLPKRDANYFKEISGLAVRPSYPALKLLWLQENIDSVRTALKGGYCKFGTLDSWIVWNLTNGALHVTDVTNASNTFLMNIHTLNWDQKLLKVFSIDASVLPDICCCSGVSALITEPLCVLKDWSITGIIADQQALLLGQTCYQGGKLNVDLNRSCCLLYNIGTKCFCARDAMTTVAYKMDTSSSCMYALEGDIQGCDKPLEWLEKIIHILPDMNDAENLAQTDKKKSNVCFVPAVNGLNAPYWRKEARGVLGGLTLQTNQSHLVRAALEAVCFQIYDVIESMRNLGDFNQDVIYVAGPYSSNKFLMQMLSDISGVTIVRFNMSDPISYGSAICAGYTINAVDMHRIKQGIWRKSMDFLTYIPLTRTKNRIQRYTQWRRAIANSIKWRQPRKMRVINSGNYKTEILNNDLVAGAIGIISVLYVINALQALY